MKCHGCMPIATRGGSYAHYHSLCREVRVLRAGLWGADDEAERCAVIAESHTVDFGHGDSNDYRRGRGDAAVAIAAAIRNRIGPQ